MADIDVLKAPPQDLAAEQAVLGAIFLDSERLIEVSEFIAADDFYKTSHQIIFRIMMRLQDERSPIDVLTVHTLLDNQGDLETIGGISYIAELAASTPTAANAAFYAKIVSEKALLRKLIRQLTESVERAYSQDEPADDIIALAEKGIVAVTEGRTRSGFRKISEIIDTNYDEIERLSKQKSTVTGISTGYPALDEKTTGLHEGELIILAARPAMGKTAFALNIAANIGKLGQTVAIFSLEMGAESLVNRMVSSEGLIDAYSLRTGKLTDDDWSNLIIAQGALADRSIYVDDSPGIKITEIRARSRKLAQEQGGLGLILIDYLQLISGTGKENRQQEVSEISRQLKVLAKELKVPVLALSQLSRGVEQREDKRPKLSDLRESGSIEQDADIVAFIHREAYYQNPNDPEVELDNKAEIIFAKNRSGETGTAELMWVGQFTKFTSIDTHHESGPSY
ncbi:MAG: replicative DNA helicase [Lactococcus sp.]|jgi:replicative DNA helicase|uniref:Replicative DNA helicase n=2 Tax=Pseudolactococcus TaxID=3436058 RepID=A0A0D6DY13_9LACT|nr:MULTISPECIES: replicative DNA helicase [Lactococcus]SCA92464.1 replicative DNA helicase;chromosome replication, chain elongation [Lactococcus piscium]MBR6896310.1 replicative DNA helicase [Lactococcus sp.]MCJ1969825.1 replicative DNA helicase [Lactococcus carnosus]MCJ1970462.1 replicative DNA helicase [Lactococcus carnosus]MCJ1974121.1 replicative DNA helicase [Lactococcus carnosus]